MAVGRVDWARVAAEYRAGATFAQLGAKWGRDPTGIRLALIREGVQLENGRERTARGATAARARRTAEAAKRHAEVSKLHADGRSVAEIAETVGYASKTVRLLIGGNKWRDDYAVRNARVVEVYQAGHTVKETARITGVQPTQVGRIVRRAGVSRRRGPAPKPAASGRSSLAANPGARTGNSRAGGASRPYQFTAADMAAGQQASAASSKAKAAQRQAEVKRLHDLGHSPEAIARDTGYNVRYVVRLTATPRSVMREKHAEVQRLHELGHSPEAIAEQTGYSLGYVCRLTGAKPRSEWRERHAERALQVIKTYSAGHTIDRTAELTGIHRSQVGRIVRRAGIVRRGTGRPRKVSVRQIDHAAGSNRERDDLRTCPS